MVDPNDLENFRRRWSDELKSSEGSGPQSQNDGSRLAIAACGCDCAACGCNCDLDQSTHERPSTSVTNHLSAQVGEITDTDPESERKTEDKLGQTVKLKPRNRSDSSSKCPEKDTQCTKNIYQNKMQFQPFLNTLFGRDVNSQSSSCDEENVREEFIISRNKRLKLSSPTSTHTECAQAQNERSVENASLLDLFISDLDEINDIPFFETSLPKELAIKIFRHLEPLELCRCSQVSKAWKSLAEDELLWSQICGQLGYEESATTIEKSRWKEIVKEHVVSERLLRNNWKMRNGEVSPVEYVAGGILCAASSWDYRLAAGYSNGKVCVWDEDDCGVFEPSSTALIIDESSTSGTISNMVCSICINEQFVAASYSQGNVDVWSMASKGRTPINTLHLGKPVERLTCCKSDPLVVMASNSELWVYQPEHSEDKGNFTKIPTDCKVSDVCIIPKTRPTRGGRLLAVGMSDRVMVHKVGEDVEKMTTIHDTVGHRVTCMDCTSHQMALGIHEDDTYSVKLYDVHKGREMCTLRGHSWLVSVMNIVDSPQNSIVTGSYDRKVRVYDTRLPEPVIVLCGHTGRVQCVQMDDWKVVSGGVDGMVIVWDQRMATKLWEQHNRHPVEYIAFRDKLMYTANIPGNKLPETDDFDSVYHRRYRGCLCLYNFCDDQTRHPALPSNALSNYDEPEGYNYNIGLAVPYDKM